MYTMYVCIYVCMYVCMYTCTCIYVCTMYSCHKCDTPVLINICKITVLYRRFCHSTLIILCDIKFIYHILLLIKDDSFHHQYTT